MRNWPTKLALFLLLVTLSATTAWAQNGKFLPQIGKDIEARFLYPAGKNHDDLTLFPLVIEYKNISSMPQVFHLKWSLDAPLPQGYQTLVLEPGATKRLPFLLAPRQANQLYSVSLNGQSLNPNVQSRARQNIVGLLVPKGDPLDYLRSMRLEKNAYYNNTNQEADEEYNTLQGLSALDTDVFPDHWGPLQSLSYLVCYDLQSLSLSTRQYQAIVKWVQQGGNLILVSNGLPTEYDGTPLQNILPFQAKDVVSTDSALRLSGQVKDSAEVVEGDKEAPVLVRQDVLKGTVSFFTVPVLKGEVLGKERTLDIWRNLFVHINQNNHNTNSPFNNSFLDDMPELPRAQAGWVALFVILYGVIVGPLNLSLLRKKDKMLWAFVTVPVVAILFAGGAYIVNRVVRPSTPVLRELGWLYTVSGSPVGVVESEQLLFSPQTNTFEIQSDNSSLFRIHQYQYRSFSNSSRQFRPYQTTPEGGLKSALEMGTWDIQRFHAFGVSDLKKPILASLANEGQELNLDTPIKSLGATAILLHPKLGASKAFQFEVGQNTYDLDFSGHNSVTYDRDERYPGRRSLAGNVSKVSNGLLQGDRAYLFFWSDELETPLSLGDEGLQPHDFLVTVEIKV